MTALYLEPDGRAMARSSDGRLWRSSARINPVQQTLSLSSGYFEGTHFQAKYAYAQPDPDHLVLTPAGENKTDECTLRLTRVNLPRSYPLLDAHFHWVQEWAVER